MITLSKDMVKFFGFSACEILIQVFGILIFTILLSLKVEHVITASWWYVFIPLFAADAFTLYFSVIVCLRFYTAHFKKEGYRRQLWILLCLSLFFTFKILSCVKLEGTAEISNSQVLAPIFSLWCIYFIRACRVK